MVIVVLSVVFAGCDLFWETIPRGEKTPVSVMTQNLYVGADINTVLGAAPENVPLAVAQFFANVQATDFRARAKAMAEEIDHLQPDLIGLQEVALYRTQTPGDYVTGIVTPNAADVIQDFLAILLEEMGRRHLNYVVVNELANSDIELPATTDGRNFFDVRLTDRDVILAHRSVGVVDETSHHYTVNLPLPLRDADGNSIPLLRGFGRVNVSVRGFSFTFVNTHLETPVAPPVQIAQATELLQFLSSIRGPVVVAGDFNSAGPGAATGDFDTDTYGLMSNSLTDAFAAAQSHENGYTCCQATDLTNASSTLAWRIDQVWYRGDMESVHVKTVGDEASDRTSSGLWPSDHAGVAAWIRADD